MGVVAVIYLSGVSKLEFEQAMIDLGVGLIVTPRSGYDTKVPRFPYWAADNGCFAPPGSKATWDEDRWLTWLDRLPRDHCLFAVAPDVYPDAQATLERSEPYFQLLREMGYPVALVAQDHAEKLRLPWDDFDCLFLGGEKKDRPRDEWKLGRGAEQLANLARRHGKWVHMGRVNSLYRIERAREMGCNSADGTYMKYRLRGAGHGDLADRSAAQELAAWYRHLDSNPILWNHEQPNHPVHRDALRKRGVA